MKKEEQEEGWDLAAYGAAYEADRPTSSFPQCRLIVCTAYLQVEIYSHIEMHSYRALTMFTSGNLLSLSDLAG